jgi:hypothetical protein
VDGVEWEEVYKVGEFRRMRYDCPSAKHGAVEFIARNGGVRTVDVDDVFQY